ncbi:hypothetical protein [uncultured Shewanella sp.]|uniref:hypothetical protein n=1 Tax=uncultured Shewanella sp. TaxID=173975 RepID=UPI002619EF62|nr:hypothetical protein [uncultured Shewanella sp.]
MKKIRKCILFIFIFLSNWANSTPMSPEANNVSSLFSVDLQNKFHLFSDSLNNNLVWYIPKVGGIKKIDDSPAFSVSTNIINEGPFEGEISVGFNGIFNAMNQTSSISKLSYEASAKGLYIKPAEIYSAETQVLLSGFKLDNNGTLESICDIEVWYTPSGEINIPVCKALDDTGIWRAIDFLSSFSSTLPISGNIDQDIPFHGKTLPGWEDSISELLNTGSSWDAEIQLLTDWTLKSNTNIKDADVYIDWRKLIEHMIYLIRNNLSWSVTLGDLDRFLRHAIKEKKGVSIYYYHENGRIIPYPSKLIQEERVIDGLIHRLRKSLFVPVYGSRINIPHLVVSSDPINPKIPYIRPTFEEIANKWQESAEIVYSRISQVRSKLDLSKTSDFILLSNCEYERLNSPSYYSCPVPLPEPCGNKCNTPILPVVEPRYMLKSNYWRLLSFPHSNFTIYFRGVELLNASTYMTINCIEGDIDVPLRYVDVCD